MLEGKVAIVTGAGRGLGRSEALHLARLGAAVVVNDYGVAVDGSKEESAAQQVVKEIISAGGKAIADGADVADWEQSKALIETAIGEFGGLDIVVNNAGILRDKMLYNMSEDEWDTVIRVHLKGTSVSHDMRRRTGGRSRRRRKGSRSTGGSSTPRRSPTCSGRRGRRTTRRPKGGIIGLTLSTANACGRFGVDGKCDLPHGRGQR